MLRRLFACAAGALLIAAGAPAIDWNDPRSVADAAVAASPSLRGLDANLGAAAQSDIIRAKVEASNLRHAILMQRGVRDSALARLRAMLDLAPGQTVPPFALTHVMEHRAHAADATLAASTPAIAALEIEVARSEEDLRLARLAAKPDLTIEASYGMRPEQKDMFSVVGRIELPIRKTTTVE